MTLHLRITKAPDGAPVSQSQYTFDEHGGSLGRGPDNHWVLPDPERILSSRHCEFLFESGRYQLLDLSTNGTFVNDSPEPLGKGTAAPVHNGDVIEVGDYRFSIEMTESAPASAPLLDSAESLSPFADAGPTANGPTPPPVSDDPFGSDPFSGGGSLSLDSGDNVVDPLKALDGVSHTLDVGAPSASPWETGADFGLDLPASDGANPFTDPEPWQGSALADSGPAGDAIAWPESRPENLIPDDWLDESPGRPPSPGGQAPAEPVPSAPSVQDPMAQEPAWPDPAPTPDPLSDTGREAPLPPEPGGFAFAEPEAPRSAPTQPAPESVARPRPGHRTRPAGAERPAAPAQPAQEDALFSAMGLDVARLSAEEREALYPLMGKLVREVIDGLMQVLRSRASIKNEFRMNVTTIQPVENNPLKFSADVDEALDNIFVRQSQAYKEPLTAVREGFQEIAEHQLAMIAGMRSAFEHMLEDFDPEKLQPRFEKQQKPHPIAPLQKGRYWRQYQDYYRGLSDNIERSFQQVFGDEFVQAYQDQLRRLAAARRP